MIKIISNSNAFSGNATRIINLTRFIDNTSVIFSGPRVKGSYHFTRTSSRLPSMLEKSLFTLRRSGLIHCFKTLPTSGLPSLIGRLRSSSLLIDWDDFEGFGGFADQDPFPYNHIADFFEKWIVRRADALTVVSPFLEKKAREYGFTGDIHFIPNGADTENIKYSFPSPSPKLRLLFIGLLYKSSDLDFVLKSMKSLNVKSELTVVGDGPKKREYELLAKKLNLKNINFIGMVPREKVRSYLYNSDVALMPFKDNIPNQSRSPVKLGEYMASGKPVVTNPVGIMNSVINGRNGILTKDDPESYAKGIEKLADARLRKKISIQARKTAEELSWKKIASRLEKIYEAYI
jgi:glycosyltransferase involved in cell wall biosynthesis